MDLSLTPLHPLFAARIAGADLSQPVGNGLGGRSARDGESAVCVLRDQQLDGERQIVRGATDRSKCVTAGAKQIRRHGSTRE
jgi:hypothetical protein